LPRESVHPPTTRENRGSDEDFESVHRLSVDTFENAVSPAKNEGGGHVDTLKPEGGRESTQMRPAQGVIAGVLE
jgi:hypothetical protein